MNMHVFLAITVLGLSSVYATPVQYDVDYEQEVEWVARPSGEGFFQNSSSSGTDKPLFPSGLVIQGDSDVAEERLAIFMGQLKAYISETTFNVPAFQAGMEKLQERLTGIESLMSNIAFSESLSSQLRFVKRMFRVMVYTADLLTDYSAKNVPGVRLLYKMAELNVRAYALHNSKGTLDLQMFQAADNVEVLIDSMLCWRDRFYSLAGVPFEVHSDFRIHFNSAESILLYLKSFIPSK
ncbi:hypothetical protein OXX80_008170 [Metschnikowia pulcherrima]